MRPPQAKFGKICQWTTKTKGAVVCGWGRQIFAKLPKGNKNSLNISTLCLFKKTDARYAFTGWKVHENQEKTLRRSTYTVDLVNKRAFKNHFLIFLTINLSLQI